MTSARRSRRLIATLLALCPCLALASEMASLAGVARKHGHCGAVCRCDHERCPPPAHTPPPTPCHGGHDATHDATPARAPAGAAQLRTCGDEEPEVAPVTRPYLLPPASPQRADVFGAPVRPLVAAAPAPWFEKPPSPPPRPALA